MQTLLRMYAAPSCSVQMIAMPKATAQKMLSLKAGKLLLLQKYMRT